MRLAIIADIHGNLDALRAVLADAQAQGAERIIVNGDVVNRGPDSVAALELLLGRRDVSFTLGNHDDLLRLWHARSADLPAEWFSDPFWGATAWSAEQLDRAGLLHAPAEWPLTRTVQHPGLPGVLIAHGSPQHYREGISEKTEPGRVRELSGGHGVLIGSHIHRPAQAQVGGVLVLNTGAVGAPAGGDPRAQYLLLTAEAGGWHAEFRAVPYDRAGVLARFGSSGLLDTGLSAQIFREEIITSRSLYTPYWLWTENSGQPRDARTWDTFLRQSAVSKA